MTNQEISKVLADVEGGIDEVTDNSQVSYL